MIAHIRGVLEYIEPEEGLIVLETGGIGYQILLSGKDMDLLPSVGEELRLYTYLHIVYHIFFGFSRGNFKIYLEKTNKK